MMSEWGRERGIDGDNNEDSDRDVVFEAREGKNGRYKDQGSLQSVKEESRSSVVHYGMEQRVEWNIRSRGSVTREPEEGVEGERGWSVVHELEDEI
ncbi:hypothetical protein Pcinc_001587 [Petrolisthes cinctipes]|uniref:Uncharacterized protein n=1 Tax=Petrolisthes cinctipes TaxID=88211 RepID=A0AAE1GMQ2_PETCI|nr:hypothetical protein Pcinc_001587 [Petrolisthes cinctipes]